MTDIDGMEGRGTCGRCGLWPPIMVGGRWIDYCLPCYVAWCDDQESGREIAE